MKRFVLGAFVALLVVGVVVPDAEINKVDVASAYDQPPLWTRAAVEEMAGPPGSIELSTPDPVPAVSAPVTDPAPISAVETVAYNPTPFQRGMDRFAALGANAEELRFFDCLAWFESNYREWVISSTGDYGMWQINRYYHGWRWRGRDIFDPVVNAEIAWDIYRESGFRAWNAARFCYV